MHLLLAAVELVVEAALAEKGAILVGLWEVVGDDADDGSVEEGCGEGRYGRVGV